MSTAFPLRVSSPAIEGSAAFSKWLKWQMLIDEEEMKELLDHLFPCSIFPVGALVNQETIASAKEMFFSDYIDYIQTLKRGQLPDDSLFRKRFAVLLSRETQALYAQPVREDNYLIKALQPAIQLQLHHFFLSDVDLKFYPMVMGSESVTWGIQYSYPQIFQQPQSANFVKVDSQFPNTALFQQILRWMRKHTLPTPFVYRDVQTNVPMRIGKKCFSWIENHPGLKHRGLSVVHRTHLHRS